MFRFRGYSRGAVLAVLATVLACTPGATAVTPVVAVDQVTVAPAALNLLVGARQTLTATPMGAGQPLSGHTVTWSTGNPAIATVGTGGQVTAVSAGNAVITATSDNINGTATVAVSNPAPTVSAMAPTTAAATSPAFILTVTGTGFVAGTTVQWNGAAVPTTVVSTTQVTAGIPAADILAAGSAAVTVFTPAPGGGTAGAQTFAISAAPNPSPTLASLAPSSKTAGGAAFALTINGTNFVAASQVMWNGSARTTTFVSTTQLTVAILAADIAAAGTAQLTVVNPVPGGGTSSALPFGITVTLPVIATLLPAAIVSGSPSFLMSVIGTNFVAGSQVQWNGSPRTTTFVSATQLTALVTAADIATTTTVQITVTNPGANGGTSTARSYAVDTPPQLALGGNPFPGQLVSASGPTVCGAKPGAQLYCWGLDVLANTLLSPTPSSAGMVFRQFSVTWDHACGVTAAGAAYCWGRDNNGQLGVNNSAGASSATPLLVQGGLTWGMVAVGDRSCGITVAGVAYCWGISNHNTFDASSVPVGVPGAPALVSVTVGSDHACGLTSAGIAYCWGSRNAGGEIGDGGAGTNEQLTAAQVSGNHTFIAISAGGYHSCGLETGGAIWCWGAIETSFGSLGNGAGLGSANGSLVPVLVSGGHIFQSVSAGDSHTCALDTTGAAWCWGEGYYGVLGQGVANSSAIPVAAAGGLTFRSITAGGPTCGVITTGAVYCWGASLALGNGSLGVAINPVPVSGGLAFTDIAVSYMQSCGITSAAVIGTPVGTTYCWGTTRTGGDPTLTDEAAPKPLANAPIFVALSDGEGDKICGRTPTGAVYCWGTTPTLFGAPEALAFISNGGDATCGVAGSGNLYCAGHPFFNGGLFAPQTAAFAGTSFSAVATDGSAFCGIVTGGLMQCLGLNSGGQLGNGSVTTANTLTAVSGGLHFTSLARGGGGTCALVSGGTAYCWGYNGSQNVMVPTAVAGSPVFTSIGVGYGATCGVESGNVPVCWNQQILSLMFPYTNVSVSTSPVAVSGPLMSKIRTGTYHACGLTPAGAAWCWGRQDAGQLGNGFGYAAMPSLVSW